MFVALFGQGLDLEVGKILYVVDFSYFYVYWFIGLVFLGNEEIIFLEFISWTGDFYQEKWV